MADQDPPKKDLTSLVDLSKLEMSQNPPSNDDAFANLEQMPPPVPMEEGDFAPLDSLPTFDSAPPEEPQTTSQPSIQIPNFDSDPHPVAHMDVSPSVLMDVPMEAPQEPDEFVEAPVENSDQAFSEAPVEQPSAPIPTSPAVENNSSSDIVINDRESPVLSLSMKTGTPQVATGQKTATSVHGKEKQDFSALKKFGEKLAIGQPRVEASPAFSILATGKFNEKAKHSIELAIKSEDFGVRFEDIEVQLSNGKFFVPQISEFAAITLAQKIRDVVDNIQIGLAGDVFKGTNAEMESTDDNVFIDAGNYAQHREEVHDLSTEPQSERDLFSSHLALPEGFKITRILSSVTASEILTQEVAKNPNSRDFELATEKLTRALITKAFVLGAHGVVGVSFTVLPIEGAADPRRAYRLLASGTAVKTRKLS